MEENNYMNVFEYVTITLAEYKKLLKKVEKLKSKLLIATRETQDQMTQKWEWKERYEDAMKMVASLKGEDNAESDE